MTEGKQHKTAILNTLIFDFTVATYYYFHLQAAYWNKTEEFSIMYKKKILPGYCLTVRFTS